MEPTVRRATVADVADIINAASASGAESRSLFGHIQPGALVETELLTLVAHDGGKFAGFLALSDRCSGLNLDDVLKHLGAALEGATITVRTSAGTFRNGSLFIARSRRSLDGKRTTDVAVIAVACPWGLYSCLPERGATD
jgi:hypothetical protein